MHENIFIADLFDNNGDVIPWLELSTCKHFPNCKYFSWVQLIDAIPHNWKSSIKNDCGRSRQFFNFNPHLITNAKIYPLEKLTSKELYIIHIKKKIVSIP